MRWFQNSSRSAARRNRPRTIRLQVAELESRIALAVITAAESGLWNAPSTWIGGVVPGAGDSAVIGAAENVFLNTNATVAGVTIEAGGQLTFDPAATRVLSSSANVEVAGILQMRPASSAVKHELSFININEANFVGGGEEVLATDVGLWFTGAGKWDAVGSDKTSWTHLSAAADAGTTTITVDATGGWKVGDLIAIAPTKKPIANPSGTDDSWQAYDERTITAISGSTVTLNAALTHSHPVVNGVWYAEVLNLSRNVKVHGAAANAGRTHIAFTGTTQPQTVKNVEIYHTGPREDKNGDGVKDIIAGRYGFHIHHADNGSRGSLIEGVVVRDSGSHAFVTHDSHGVTYRNTISHDTFETAYWWDFGAGNETHDVLYDRAVASKIFHSGSVVNAEPDGGKRTAGFWLGTGNRNTVINSVAIGVEGRQHVSSQTSGFLWPEATGDSIWTFHHNVSHNNGANGIFTWQNAPMPEHRIEDFVGYYNYQGIEHGAYTNRYQYRRLHLYGNVKAGLNVHATSSSINNPLSFEDSTIDGAGLTSYAVYSPAHNANADLAILLQNNTIRNLRAGGTVLYCDKGTLAETGTGFREWWTLRNNIIEGNPNLFWLRGSFSDKDGDAQIDYADTNGDGDINSLDNGAGQTGGPELFGVGTDTDIYVEQTNGEAYRVRSKYYNFPNEGALPLVSAWNARKQAIRPAGTPIVDAGTNRTIFAPTNVVSLDGTVIDPAPGGTLTTTWSKVSGPGTVTFGNAALVDTTAAFSTTGVYVLKLTASDGTNPSHFDQLTVYYNPANPSHTVTETWTGANGAAWPSQWTREISGGNPLVEINTNRGHINSNGAAGARGPIYINSHNAADVEMVAEFKVTGNRDSVGLFALRSDNDPDTYFLVEAAINEPIRIYFVLNGTKKVQAETTYEPVTTAWFKLRFLVQRNPDGTSNVLAKYWLTTAAEPAGWTVQLKNWSLDPRMLGKSGRFGLYFQDKAGGNGADVWYDNFTATTNMAPIVHATARPGPAGPGVWTADLDGTVTDDAVTSPLTYAWTKVSGPGTVSFGNAAAVDTTATISAAGTYVLRLTANDGNRTAAKDVTVKVQSETFTAADGSAWPAQWTRQGVAGSAATVNIQGNEGEVTNTGGGGYSNVQMVNNTAVARDTDTQVKFRTNGVGAITSLFARRADASANTYYKAAIYVGSTNLSISKVVNGVKTTLAVGSFTLDPNTDHIIRFQVVTNAGGTTDLRVKVWAAAAAEPSSWTLTVSGDATAQLQGVAGRTGTGAEFIWTDNTRKIWFDDYKALVI